LKKEHSHYLPLIGWREWVGLPDLGVSKIKAKVDTGARSSSLHVNVTEEYEVEGVPHVRFEIYSKQRRPEYFVEATAKVIDHRQVKSSSGTVTTRPVIMTRVRLLGQVWLVELTLANREGMGFRMLLGREAFRGKFIVDAGNSYYSGRPKRKKKVKPPEPPNERAKL